MLKRIFLLSALLALPILLAAATHTASWTAVITYTDGSTITLPVTYNLFTGQKGALVATQSGLTTLSTNVNLTDASPCAAVQTEVNGVVSALSNTVCLQFTPSASTLTLQ